MSATKKLNADSDNQISSRIQRKFDLVFSGTEANSSTNTSGEDEAFDELEASFSSTAQRKLTEISPINLDFSLEEDSGATVPETSQQNNSTSHSLGKKGLSKSELPLDELEFSLDFDSAEELRPETFGEPDAAAATSTGIALMNFNNGPGGLDLENFGDDFAEETKKTIMINISDLGEADLKNFNLEAEESNSSADLMSSEEAKANIESTIKDILRPKILDGTQAIDLEQLQEEAPEEDYDLTKTPSDNFTLDVLMNGGVDPAGDQATNNSQAQNSVTGEFYLDPSEFSIAPEEKTVIDATSFTPAPEMQEIRETKEVKQIKEVKEVLQSMPTSSSFDAPRTERINEEDFIRFHSTIRQLREEREELLVQIKQLKSEQKDLEQDNLSLKAGMDEAKIEISILRKRHLIEIEDLKYRMTLSEEKKAMAEEKARQAELRRDKLEQKVRIDYNQVKLREKELESKLEMLSMDVDSQVKGRDQKILELRRKIDALEFNMENASMKEQRSSDDKRKLEDKLNKIMKTLRNSIKNLEEDIDLVQEEMPTTDKN